MNYLNKNGEKKSKTSSFSSKIKQNRIKLTAIFASLAIIISAFALFAENDRVAFAAAPVLWGHKVKSEITSIGEAEIARFDDGTTDTDTRPATYDDKTWGDFVAGGINRVSKEALLTVRPSKTNKQGALEKIDGVGVMDTYSAYKTQNVTVVRYKGGEDSNLGISVNSESKGYIKMDVSGSSARYLYYSISVEALAEDSKDHFGTFAVNIGKEKSLVVRTEKNQKGGAAFLGGGDAYKTYGDENEDIKNWVSGYEYGCIDLKSLTGNESESVSAVYLFGNSKTKVMLNYLILSDDAPTKIDVVNGNILYADGKEGDDSPEGVDRSYSNSNGYQGTGKMTLKSSKTFSFENLVVDTKITPYLYYSFTAEDSTSEDSNKADLSVVKGSENDGSNEETTYKIAKKDGKSEIVSVTGCIKVSTLVGKEGLINFSTKDDRGRSFTFGEGGNLTVNYLFFGTGLVVSNGENVIVKNADAYNIDENNDNNKDYKVTNFSDGSLDTSYTYDSKGVWAPFTAEISDTNIDADFCWYVNTIDAMNGAKKIGDENKNFSGSEEVTLPDESKVNIKATVTVETTENGAKKTTLTVSNPTKRHNGLYFFCLVVGKKNTGSFSFTETLDSDSIASLEEYWNLTGGFCRLDVANNIVYHEVDKDGVESVIIKKTDSNGVEKENIKEDWLVYGTDCKVTGAFEKIGGYLKYDLYKAPTPNSGAVFKNGSAPVCEAGYKLMDYSYSLVDPNTTDVVFNGWMHFDETVKNPHGAQSHTSYVNAYKDYYAGKSIFYTSDVEHKSWTLHPEPEYSLSLDGDRNSIIHDTTVNLYTKWEIPVEAHKLNVDVFVDQFGTSFIAKETKDGFKIISSDKDDSGKNKFIEDTIYVAVAPIKKTSSNGIIQYKSDSGAWVDIDSDKSELKDAIEGVYPEESGKINKSDVENWYDKNTEYEITEYDYGIIYAVKIDTDDLLGAFYESGVNYLDKELTVTFRYVAGTSNADSWFDFTGKAECGSFRFIPFKYNEMT